MRLRTTAILLLLCLTLGASAGFAAESRARVAHREEPGAGQFLILFQQVGSYLVALWGAEGCRIDPLGRCAADQRAGAALPTGPNSNVQTVDADEGCRIDPWGRCATNQNEGVSPADAGCIIDPWGCAATH